MGIVQSAWGLAALCFTAYVALAFVWIFGSKQDMVERNARTAAAVVARIAVMHAFLIGFGLLVGYDLDHVVGTLPQICIGFFISYLCFLAAKAGVMAPVAAPVGDDPVSIFFIALIFTSACPFLACTMFVLGFPVRSAFRTMTEPEPFVAEELKHSGAAAMAVEVGTVGTISATLRPMGTVDIDGSIYAAKHINSAFMESGSSVIVCGKTNGTLIIKESPTPSDPQNSENDA